MAFQAMICATFSQPNPRGGFHSINHCLTIGAPTAELATAAAKAIETDWRYKKTSLIRRVTALQSNGSNGFTFSRFINSVEVNEEQQYTIGVADQTSPTLDSFNFIPFTTHLISIPANSKDSPSAGQSPGVVVDTLAFRLVVGGGFPIAKHFLDVGPGGKQLAVRYLNKPRLTPAARAAFVVAMLCMTRKPLSPPNKYSLPQELHRYLLLGFVQWESYATEHLPR